jgi:SprT protein
MNDYELKEAIRKRYKDCCEIAATKYNIPVNELSIRFDLTNVTAGMFCWNMHCECYFRVNLEIARNNFEDYLKRTIPHEVSHYIARLMYGYVRSHGREWKRIMWNIFGLEPSRCHSYDVKDIIVKKKPHKYNCGCGTEHYLSNIVHRRVQLNPLYYRCNLCRTVLTYQK